MTFILVPCTAEGCDGRVEVTAINWRGAARGRCTTCRTLFDLERGQLVEHDERRWRGLFHPRRQPQGRAVPDRRPVESGPVDRRAG